jgi:uncharacterized RDD family membrane protein YckC
MSEQSSYGTSGDGPSGPRAGFWRRFVASLLDGLILGVLYLIVLVVLDEAVAGGLYLLANLVYFAYFEGAAAGQTPGKKALGIRVIDFKTGGSIGYGRAFIRYIGRIVSSIPLGLGYFWMLWDKEKQTWHDKFAGSVVVPESAYPTERWP